MGSFPETLIDLKSVTSKYPICDNPPRARRSFAPSQDTAPKLQFLSKRHGFRARARV